MSRPRSGRSTLPDHLLLTIVELLQTRLDLLRLRAVCKSFRSVIPLPNVCSPHLDLYYDFYDYDHGLRDFIPLVIKQYTIYAVEPISQIPASISTAQHSSKAWFVKVKESNSGKVQLLEPFMSLDFKHIYDMLPKSLSLFDYRVKEIAKEYSLQCVNDSDLPFCRHRKVAVSTDSGDELVLMTLVNSKVHIWRSRNKKWVRVRFRYSYRKDVIYHNRKFFVLMANGRAITVDPDRLKCSVAAPPQTKKRGVGDKSFVKSGNDLFMVCKNHKKRYCMNIFKFHENEGIWVPVEDGLGDRALFMFEGSNFFVSAKEFNVCKPNCVYSSWRGYKEADDNDYPGKDAKIFSFEDGTTEYLTAFPGYSEIFWPPPTWLVPK